LNAPLNAALFFTAMDGGYAENAGAFFGGCLDGTTPSKRNGQKCRSIFGPPWMAGMPKLQEQISAGGCLDFPLTASRN
jgi:hypothetical protein